MSEAERNIEELDNSFPVSAFPEAVQEIILATNHYLKFPIDFIGASILFAASVAVGNSYEIKRSWLTNAVLYITLVGRPGTAKSPVLSFFLEPHKKRDSESYFNYQKAVKEYKKALRNNENEPPEKPNYKRCLMSDLTQEALVDAHFYNLRGLGVYSDELNSWLKNFNRYNAGSSQEFWLQIFSGTPIINDRKGQEPVLITKPFVSVIGGLQPGILNELSKENRGQNGFIDRFLFAYPENIRKEKWNDDELPDRFVKNWEIIINNLFDAPLNKDENGKINPTILEFSASAYHELKIWQAKNADLINETPNDGLAGVYSKLEIFVIRFALIIELLKRATDESPEYKKMPNDEKLKWLYRQAAKICHPDKRNIENAEDITKALTNAYSNGNLQEVERIYLNLTKPVISVRSVESAIKLVEYFRKTAKKVNSILNNSPVEGLDQRKRAIFESLGETFTTNDAVIIASKMDYSERAVKEFLNDRTFFNKIKYGHYKKII